MNTHTIVGVVCKEPELKSGSGSLYLKLRVQDKTKYNGTQNPTNNYHCIKYGTQEGLNELRETLFVGAYVYVSGEGLYNKLGYYNIILNKIELLDKVTTVEVIKDEYKSYYEKLYIDEEKEGRIE